MKCYVINTEKFQRILESKKLTVRTFADGCGTSVGTIYNWISGKSSPNYISVKRINDMMGIDINTCLERSEGKTVGARQ